MTSVRTEKAEVTRRLSSDTWRDCTVSGPSGDGLCPVQAGRSPASTQSQLTAGIGPTIMMKLGNRVTRVNINPNRQGEYDRIRPQGGRRFRAFQSLGSEYRRDSGKRDGGTGDVSERRGCTGGANAFLEGAANGGGKALRVRRFSGDAAQKLLNCLSSSSPSANARRQFPQLAACPLPWLVFFLLLVSALLSACGGHKPAQAQVPPPPSLPREKPAATAPPAETSGQAEKIDVPTGAKPIFEETGMASWYGAPYHNRRGSNGEVYNM